MFSPVFTSNAVWSLHSLQASCQLGSWKWQHDAIVTRLILNRKCVKPPCGLLLLLVFLAGPPVPGPASTSLSWLSGTGTRSSILRILQPSVFKKMCIAWSNLFQLILPQKAPIGAKYWNCFFNHRIYYLLHPCTSSQWPWCRPARPAPPRALWTESRRLSRSGSCKPQR